MKLKLRHIAAAVVVTGVASFGYINQEIDALGDDDIHVTISPAEKNPDTDLPDPDRNYFDGAGNQYDYQGNLISSNQPAAADTFRGK